MISKNRTSLDNLFLVFKGIAMGAANKVPGVSGGVVAFVGGFYEEFLFSLQKINLKALNLLFTLKFRAFWQHINGKFLAYLILGMLISFFSVSKLLDYLLFYHEIYVWSTFFGMIIGSVIYLCKVFDHWNLSNIIFASVSMALGLVISSLPPATQNDHLVFVFFCGLIGVSGMTLPGLSGSFILIILGNYVLLLVDSVNALFDALVYMSSGDFTFLDDKAHLRLLSVLLVFSLGSLVGLVSFSHLLGYLLKRYKGATFASIIGFIVGSLGIVWPWKNRIYKVNFDGEILKDVNGSAILDHYVRYLPDLNDIQTIIAVSYIFFGCVFVLFFERLAVLRRKKRHKKN